MNGNTIRLNPATFVRVYPDSVYLENQTAHTRAQLPLESYGWLSSMQHGREYNVEALKAGWPQGNFDFQMLMQLDEAWLIDTDSSEGFPDRRFSYARKAEIENRFGDYPVIGNANGEGLPRLRNLQLELTDACNERCRHCYLPNAKKDSRGAMPTEQTIGLLRQYREMGGLKVVFSGGEIMLHPGLFDILDECKKLGLMILLQTNLLAITAAHIERIKRLNVFNVQVSLYSTDPLIHDTITRRKGSYLITKRNLELLVENDIPAMISCPVMQTNFATVASLRSYAERLGVDIYFDFMMMAECDGSRDNLESRLSREQVGEMLKFQIDATPAIVEAIAKSGTLAEALSKMYARRRTVCSILSSSLCIDSDGTAYPCPGWNGMKLGNISSSTLQEIWNSPAADKLRAIRVGDYDKCSTCDKRNFCDMCAVYNYNENGNLYDICPRFCEMAEMLRQCVIEKYNELHK